MCFFGPALSHVKSIHPSATGNDSRPVKVEQDWFALVSCSVKAALVARLWGSQVIKQEKGVYYWKENGKRKMSNKQYLEYPGTKMTHFGIIPAKNDRFGSI